MTLEEELKKIFSENPSLAREGMTEYGFEYKDGYLIDAEYGDLSPENVEDEEDLIKIDLDRIEAVESYGGEDCGSEYWGVWKFVRGDEEVLIRFDGWYASFVGADYTDFRVVKPVLKEVVHYE